MRLTIITQTPMAEQKSRTGIGPLSWALIMLLGHVRWSCRIYHRPEEIDKTGYDLLEDNVDRSEMPMNFSPSFWPILSIMAETLLNKGSLFLMFLKMMNVRT